MTKPTITSRITVVRPREAPSADSPPWARAAMPAMAAASTASASSVARKKPSVASQMRTKSPKVGFQRPACPPMPARSISRRL